MKRLFRPGFLSCLLLLLALVGQQPLVAVGEPMSRGMVASVNSRASAIGLQVLKSGGNAIDAAVAVGLALGVVDAHNSGIGGGCFMLIRLADGRIVAIDGRETAPEKAYRDMFLRGGKADTRLSQVGALASGVPGELAAFDYAIQNFGRKPLKELLEPSAVLAENGFQLSKADEKRLAAAASDMALFQSTSQVYFKDGKPLKAGDTLRQADLAKTYRKIGEAGITWFYQGDFSRAAAGWMRTNGGLMTEADFAKYHVKIRKPVETNYRGYRVVSFAPPSSGGVHLVQMLNILERFDLKQMDEAGRWHVIAEAMKLAFADRAYWLGDPDYARVPKGLLSKEYARSLAQNIRLDRTNNVAGHGMPPAWETSVFEKHTTHFSTADAEGNWVACTATINTTFGSKVIIPGTGVLLNNQMDDFSAQPGVPNHFGLVGGEANAVEPGKRPLSSMCPTLVFENNEPIIALGAAGGPRIINAVLCELVYMLDLGLTPAEAVMRPRIHHQWSPDQLFVEDRMPEGIQSALGAHGHKIKLQETVGVSQIVGRDAKRKGFNGGADPRVGGSAMGW